MKKKTSLFVILVGLILSSLQTAAQTPTGTIKPKPQSKALMKDGYLEIDFPDIKGWETGYKETFPTKELGYSFFYKSRVGGTVTLYVYNLGNKVIPNNLTGLVKAQMNQAKGDIVATGTAGHYQNVKEIKSGTLVLGGPTGKVSALQSLFHFSVQGRDVESYIYLFPYKNHFIKIRATRPLGDGKTPNKPLADLLWEMDNLFSS